MTKAVMEREEMLVYIIYSSMYAIQSGHDVTENNNLTIYVISM